MIIMLMITLILVFRCALILLTNMDNGEFVEVHAPTIILLISNTREDVLEIVQEVH